MKAIYLPSVRQLKQPQFWLLSLATALVAIHLTLIWRTKNLSNVVMSPLFYLAVASLLWEKRHSFRLGTTVSSIILGALLITWVVLNSTSATTEHFLLIFPFISGLGLSLLASGFKGLKLYRQELIVLFFLGTPKALISSFFDISVLTAKFSTFLLWYSGFKVTVPGVHIILPTGTVEVKDGCSGLNPITKDYWYDSKI